MEVISRPTSSCLNPDAPLFVPWAYQSVEDFSKEWWDLIQSTAWFRDYWLEETYDQDDDGSEERRDGDFEADDGDFGVCGEGEVFLPEISVEFHDQKGNGCKDLVSLGGLKWKESRCGLEKTKKTLTDKAPKIVNVKPTPRLIQQPR